MDSEVAEFLTTGTVHPTCRSHRAAAKSYHAFLLKEKKSRAKRSIQFSRQQARDLNKWDPIKPPHLCPTSLVKDPFFARFLIYTLKDIQDDKLYPLFQTKGPKSTKKSTYPIYDLPYNITFLTIFWQNM